LSGIERRTQAATRASPTTTRRCIRAAGWCFPSTRIRRRESTRTASTTSEGPAQPAPPKHFS